MKYLTVTKQMAQDLELKTIPKKTICNAISTNDVFEILSIQFEQNSELCQTETKDEAILFQLGSILELTYNFAKIAERTNNTDVLIRLSELKNSYNKLIDTLTEYKSNSKLNDFIVPLQKVLESLSHIKITSSTYTVTQSSESNTKFLQFKKQQNVNFDKKQFETLISVLEKLRSQLITHI